MVSLNPDLETDAVYTDFVVDPPKGAVIRKTSYHDNNWLSEESKEKIETLKARDPDTFHHVYEGATRSTVEGAIYKDEIQAAEKDGRIREVPFDPTSARRHILGPRIRRSGFDLGSSEDAF